LNFIIFFFLNLENWLKKKMRELYAFYANVFRMKRNLIESGKKGEAN